MDETKATVTILDRSYSLRVAESDLEVLRTAAKQLDDMARSFGRQFPSKDHQDLISMVALLQEVQLLKMKQAPSPDNEVLQQRLQNINSQLDKALQ